MSQSIHGRLSKPSSVRWYIPKTAFGRRCGELGPEDLERLRIALTIALGLDY